MKKKRKSGIVNLFIFILFLISLFLGYKINEKKHFIDLPAIQTWLPYENWFKPKDSFVSNQNEYHHLIDHYYTNGSTSCISLFDGIVMEKTEDTITILHDNGVEAIYGELTHVIVNVDDRILKGNTIASINETLTIEFKMNEQILSYEEVMKL